MGIEIYVNKNKKGKLIQLIVYTKPSKYTYNNTLLSGTNAIIA